MMRRLSVPRRPERAIKKFAGFCVNYLPQVRVGCSEKKTPGTKAYEGRSCLLRVCRVYVQDPAVQGSGSRSEPNHWNILDDDLKIVPSVCYLLCHLAMKRRHQLIFESVIHKAAEAIVAIKSRVLSCHFVATLVFFTGTNRVSRKHHAYPSTTPKHLSRMPSACCTQIGPILFSKVA